MLKRLFLILGVGGVVLWLAGPLHERIGDVFHDLASPHTEQPAKASFPPPMVDVQRALHAAGLDPGPFDGRMGRQTRNALKAFQSAHDLKPTGEVKRDTWEALQALTREAAAPVASDATTPTRLSAATQAAAPSPDEEFAAEQSSTLASKDAVRSAVLESRLRSPDRIRRVQSALRAAGFDPGPIDGELGSRTDQALRAFQKAHALQPDGVVGMKTWTALNEYLEPGSALARERAALED